MANAPKRMWVAQDQEFRDYCLFFMGEKATEVLLATTPNADDLALAKKVYAKAVSADNLAYLAVLSTALGNAIDSNVTVGQTFTISAAVADMIRTAIYGLFHTMALAYRAAGLLEG